MNWYNRVFGIQDVEQLMNQQLATQPQTLPEEPERERQGPKPVANLNLILFDNGHVNILNDWAEESNSTAEMYGKFLYKILSGQIEPFALEQLGLYSEAGVVSPAFIEKILHKYKEEKLRFDDEPVVTPSNALKLKHVRGDDATIS